MVTFFTSLPFSRPWRARRRELRILDSRRDWRSTDPFEASVIWASDYSRLIYRAIVEIPSCALSVSELGVLSSASTKPGKFVKRIASHHLVLRSSNMCHLVGGQDKLNRSFKLRTISARNNPKISAPAGTSRSGAGTEISRVCPGILIISLVELAKWQWMRPSHWLPLPFTVSPGRIEHIHPFPFSQRCLRRRNIFLAASAFCSHSELR